MFPLNNSGFIFEQHYMITFNYQPHQTTKYAVALLFLVLLISYGECQSCGNGLYQPPSQSCDDGNNNSGDGCSSACTVEPNYRCQNTNMAISVCKINSIVNLEYVGVQRDTSSNSAILYFTLTPYFSTYLNVNFNGLLVSNVPYISMTINYKQNQHLLEAKFQYTQDIENTKHDFQLLLNQSNYFWNASDTSVITLNGVNCQLTYDPALWMHNVMMYVVLSLVCIALIVFISSIFFERFIGLQLIQTYQSVFFIFALMRQYPFQFSALYEFIRYSNGFDDILPSNYYRTYTLINRLNALAMQKQFISNYNIMFLLIIVSMVTLIIIGLVKRRYRLILEQQILSKINQKLQKMDRINTFVFQKIFLSVVFFSMFKVIFSFSIQISNQRSIVEVFIDQINIIACLVAFIIVFGMISYMLFWFLLLPKNYTEDQQFMTIRFQNMKLYYPIMYITYQMLFILIICIYLARQFAIYLLLVLQCVYLIIIIITRPYNTPRILNQRIDNFTIIFNQVTTVLTTAVAIRWNLIIGTTYQSQSNHELMAYFFIILVFLTLVIILAIVRLYVFNRDVSCCCFCEEQKQKIQEITYEAMKKSLIDNNFKQTNPSKLIIQNRRPLESQAMKNDSINETNLDIIQAPNDPANPMLNDRYVEWAQQNSSQTQNKKTFNNIKNSTSKKKTHVNKSFLQQYLQMQQLNQRQQQTREYHNFQQ